MHPNRSTIPGSTGGPRHGGDDPGGDCSSRTPEPCAVRNEGRYRTFERVLGLARDQANLATVVMMIAAVDAARRSCAPLKLAPSVGGLVFANAALRERSLLPRQPGAPEVPACGGLLAVAAGGTIILALGGSLDGVRAAVRGFVGRYGHHVRRARGVVTGGARRLTERD